MILSDLLYPQREPDALHAPSLRERVSAWGVTKVADVRNQQVGTSTETFASLGDDGVTPPSDRQTTLWNGKGEEDDDGGHGDTGGEGRSEHVVVFDPEGEIPLPDELEGEPDDIHVADKVTHVVRGSPGGGASSEHDWMDLTKELGSRPKLAEAPVTDDDEYTKWETEQHEIVSLAGTEQSLGADGTPEDSGGEKGSLVGAGESESSIIRADIFEAHGQVENGRADTTVDHVG